jgi:2,4-dienoyl-CoA reductase-like NADH-dependent reductase (Old Yellow Enzyme family)
MPSLNDPIRIGDLDLPNRVLMAPLTRSNAHPSDEVREIDLWAISTPRSMGRCLMYVDRTHSFGIANEP